MAGPSLPAWRRCTVSSEKVEKVVREPVHEKREREEYWCKQKA
jgi:hypothetical protein